MKFVIARLGCGHQVPYLLEDPLTYAPVDSSIFVRTSSSISLSFWVK